MKLISLLTIIMLFLTAPSQAPTVAERDAPAKITIAKNQEPGERLIVTGTVFASEGTKPLAGASVYVYHTDAKGLYTPDTNDNRDPRLRGYMRTDAQGRYEFSTIKPASYPNTRVLAHIHYVVSSAGYQERVFEIIFEGDPYLDDQVRAKAASEGSVFSLRPLTRDQQGVLRCQQDIRMRK